MSGGLLGLQDVTVRFGGVVAVSDLSLGVGRAESLGVIGPNGAGKSTSLNVMSGFVQPVAGDVLFDGISIRSLPPHRRARAGIARTFQNAQLFAGLTVAENLEVARRQVHRRRATNLSIGEALELCGCAALGNVRSERLTAGERRFAELARCLATTPSVVLMDEPATGLRQDEVEELARIINHLRVEAEIASVIVSHDMRLISEVCGRVVVFDYGAILAEGTPDQVRANPAVVSAYLGEVPVQ